MLLLSALLITGCASSTDTTSSSDTSAASGDDTTAETTTAETVANDQDELGEYDFEGDEFHMFERTTPSIHGAIDAVEETGDVLNDAIYNRNRSLEERFNFVFQETVLNKTDDARTAVLAGDDTYDLITTRCVYAFNYAAEGIVIPVSNIPLIDLDKDYWNKDLTDNMTIMNKNFFAVGDFNLTGMDFTHLLLFNKEVAENFKVGDLYQIVKDGDWTIDKYAEMLELVTADLNGDGVKDKEDRYGIVATAKQFPPNFWIASGLLSVEKDADDKPVFKMPTNEKFFTLLDKVYQITWDNNAWYSHSETNEVTDTSIQQFQSGLALFMDSSCFHVARLRAMEADFGILPYPKYDEAQDKYYARIEGCELFCVPVTQKNLDFAGAVLEAMACESRKEVVPAYYDMTIRTKITRDEESIEMLDLIFANRVFDWGDTIWCPDIRDGIFDDMFIANDRDFASQMAELETKINALIETTVENFSKIG